MTSAGVDQATGHWRALALAWFVIQAAQCH
jgi:hypothetical protein